MFNFGAEGGTKEGATGTDGADGIPVAFVGMLALGTGGNPLGTGGTAGGNPFGTGGAPGPVEVVDIIVTFSLTST